MSEPKSNLITLFGRSYNPIGDNLTDLLLRTKGCVKILVGNQFLDLIIDGKINENLLPDKE